MPAFLSSDDAADAPATADGVPADGSAPATPDAPWPVGVLADKLKGWIDRLGTVWVEGELTQWQLRGGTAYGKLKDPRQDVTIGITVWGSTLARLDERFQQGDRVIALVKPDYWIKGGSLSMQVYRLRHVGLGDLLERIERLRRELAAEGLFAADRKRPLPFLPGCVGLVTGKDSDAEQDVLRNARLRWPGVAFRVRHAAVQGDRAATEVMGAIRRLDDDPEVDVIIVARGGGDFQNLLPFSDERLLRAVAACTTPVISAIGHENDRPLLDEVADVRASTPTDAAKRVVPDVAEELAKVAQVRTRMGSHLTRRIATEIDRVGELRTRPVLAQPDAALDRRAQELASWSARGAQLVDHRLELAGAQVAELVSHLRTLSPRRTLERGYAIARLPDGTALRAVAEAPSGTDLRLTVADGDVAATVD